MSWSRLALRLLLAVTISVQTVAAADIRFACIEQQAGSTTAVHPDCHASDAADSQESAPCCGDTCPDMAFCAAGHAASTPAGVQASIDRDANPFDGYLLPPASTRLSLPFRPPATSCA